MPDFGKANFQAVNRANYGTFAVDSLTSLSFAGNGPDLRTDTRFLISALVN